MSAPADEVGVPAWLAYLAALRQLRVEKGNPSLRAIQAASGANISHTTVGVVLNGKRLPPWSIVRNVVWGLDPQALSKIHELWQAALLEQESQQTAAPLPTLRPTTPVEELRAIRGLLQDLVDLIKQRSS